MEPALAGIRVVEQGTFITGPCAGMMLADLGADVIKIESPEGDPYRAYQGGQYSPHFQAYNRNKRSLALDMKQAGDRELFEKLIREADVYIQNFRPGTAERLGAGVERLLELNPRLVYCSISGFGATRSVRRAAELRLGRPGAEWLPERGGGLSAPAVPRARTRRCDHRHVRLAGNTRALVQRGRTGRGCHVEVSMLEAMAHFAIEPFAAFFALGQTPNSADRPRLAQAYILRTADERLIAIHLSSLEKFWQRAGGGARGPGARERSALQSARASHRRVRHAAPRAGCALRAPAAGALGRAPAGRGRAVRAGQPHR